MTDTTKLPKHKFWGAGEPDCPADLKAPNGELHTTRCKICGDGWRKSKDVCLPDGYELVMVPKLQPADEPDWDECIRQAEVATGLTVERHTLSIVIREVRRWLAGRPSGVGVVPDWSRARTNEKGEWIVPGIPGPEGYAEPSDEQVLSIWQKHARMGPATAKELLGFGRELLATYGVAIPLKDQS